MAIVLCELDRLSPIEFLRRNAGLSTMVVEMATGLPYGSVNMLERGTIDASPDMRRRLACFFEQDEETLFGLTDEPD